MTTHDWKVLGAFGILLGALSMLSPKVAVTTASLATFVVVVKNADKIPGVK